MSGSLLLFLSYGLLAIFVVAFVVRCVGIARLPVHLRWELAPVPKDSTRGKYGGSYLEEYEWWTKPRKESLSGELAVMGREIFLMKALWDHNRRLWWWSLAFHAGLYLLIAATGLLALGGILSAAGVAGAGAALFGTGLPWVAGAGCVLGGVGTLGLVASRLLRPDLRVMSSRVAYANLLLTLAVFATGAVAVLAAPDFGDRIASYGGALLTADAGAALPAAVAVHVVVALVFLAYLPFSEMMHFAAKFFTYHQVRWDDQPLEAGSRLEREVQALMRQPVTWAAPHVGADGVKTWADLAKREAKP